MLRQRQRLPILRVAALFLLCATVTSAGFADQRKLVILHTNDFHGRISQENEYAGAARITSFVKQTRKEHPGVLVLDAGDSISGTPVSTMFKGVPIFEVLNKVGYDAAAIGNHEFDHGYQPVSYTHLTLPTIYSV